MGRNHRLYILIAEVMSHNFCHMPLVKHSSPGPVPSSSPAPTGQVTAPLYAYGPHLKNGGSSAILKGVVRVNPVPLYISPMNYLGNSPTPRHVHTRFHRRM